MKEIKTTLRRKTKKKMFAVSKWPKVGHWAVKQQLKNHLFHKFIITVCFEVGEKTVNGPSCEQCEGLKTEIDDLHFCQIFIIKQKLHFSTLK